MTLKMIVLPAVCALFSAATIAATPVGLSVQAYPAGVIAEAQVIVPQETHRAVYFGVGYNFTDRRDYGEHDDEEGGGPGVTLGYRFMPRDFSDGWFVGARADLWFLKIDWQDAGRYGTTDVMVLQPTAEAGYSFPVSEGWSIHGFLNVGAEINIDTDGEDVGEGPILLIGAAFTRPF